MANMFNSITTKKITINILLIVSLLLFSLPLNAGLFNNNVPPSSPPGFVCSIYGCTFVGDSDLNGFTMSNGIMTNMTLINITVIDSVIINEAVVNSTLNMDNNDIININNLNVNGEISGENMFLREDMLRLNPLTTSPEICTASILGAIYYDTTNDFTCVCRSTGWRQMNDGTTICS